MKFVGAHVSAEGGVENAPGRAVEIGANAFALFVKNQKQWFAKPLSETSIAAFKKNLKESGIKPKHVLPHDGYLINLGNQDQDKRSQSLASFIDELSRCGQLGLPLLNFHPGAHLKLADEETCLKTIAAAVREALQETEKVCAVIENTAGQGSSVGYRFEHLARLIELIGDEKRVGVCLDTCHLFASGYDLRTEEFFTKTMGEFKRLVGFKFLKAVHLNDAKSKFESRVDRHDNLGKGNLGLDPFRLLMNDKRFDDIPLVLETSDASLWPSEIKLLRSFENGK
jgi:deoxyribonuclease-4